MTVTTEALSNATLDRLMKIAEEESPLLVERWIYRGAQAPQRFVVASADELESYLRENWRPGDAYWFWRLDECCPTSCATANLVVPNADGSLVKGGPY